MLTIDRLRLKLPAALQNRAGEIVRLLSEEMAGIPLTSGRYLERLALPPLAVTPETGSREVARTIVAAIAAKLQKT